MKHVAFVLALALSPLAALPSAEAHAEPFTQAKSLAFGPYYGILEPRPSPMYANSALSMTSIFTRAADGTLVTRGITPWLDLVDANGAKKTVKMEPDGSGYFVASIAVTRAGDYTAGVRVEDATGSYANSTTFAVYREIGLRFHNEDPLQPDPLQGKPYVISIVTKDPDGLAVVDTLEDLSITLEHWSDDHAELLGSETFPMKRVAKGTWRLDHTFAELGMQHIRFSSRSGNFTVDDVPILHSTVFQAPPEQDKNTPVPLGVMTASLVLAALLMRRRAQ